MAGLRAGAERSVKADLALRALADAEDLQVSDEELDQYLAGMAAQAGLDSGQVRDRIDRSGRLPAVRSEQRKAKAVDLAPRSRGARGRERESDRSHGVASTNGRRGRRW